MWNIEGGSGNSDLVRFSLVSHSLVSRVATVFSFVWVLRGEIWLSLVMYHTLTIRHTDHGSTEEEGDENDDDEYWLEKADKEEDVHTIKVKAL